MVESTCLENKQARKGLEGSNPSLSAKLKQSWFTTAVLICREAKQKFALRGIRTVGALFAVFGIPRDGLDSRKQSSLTGESKIPPSPPNLRTHRKGGFLILNLFLTESILKI